MILCIHQIGHMLRTLLAQIPAQDRLLQMIGVVIAENHDELKTYASC